MSNGSYRPTGFGGFSFFPPVIKNLLIANGVVFFITLLFENILIGGVPATVVINKYFALIPLSGLYYADFMPWQLITYQFIHANFSHILFNMFALWMFGAELEQIMGSKKFLFYYLLSGIGAGVLHLVLTPLLTTGGVGPTVGASGAVYGVMIAFALMNPDRYIYIYFLIPVKAKYLIGFLMLIEFFAINSAGSNVAHLAHLGGALTGFLFLMLDKSIHIPLKSMLNSGGRRRSSSDSFFGSGSNPFNYRRPKPEPRNPNIEDATFFDVDDRDRDREQISQEEIDRILDKISQSGYGNLSEREKRILFEASKRMK